MRFPDPWSSSPSGKAGGLTGRAQAQPCRPWQTVVMWKRLSHFPPRFSPHRGHSPEWYNKGFGHLCAAEVARIRNSFQPLIAEGPETKIWVFPSVTSNSGKKKRKQTLVGESVSVRKQERERNRLTKLMLKSRSTEKWECRRCKNFWELFLAFLETATSLLI